MSVETHPVASVVGLHDPMVPRTYRLVRTRQECSDTFTVELEPEGRGDIPAFLPGQFNMLYIFGVGEIPISISGDPARRDTLVHTTRAVGNVTRAMKQLKAGDVVGVRGPFGSSWPVDELVGQDVVLVAGGIGLAPLRPALYSLIHRRERYGKIVLLYGTRSPDDILFRTDLERWRAHLELEVYVTVDRAIGRWRGNVGVVTTLIPRAPFDPSSTAALVCGPEVMMRFTVMELTRRGVPEESIHISMERNMKCAVGYCGHCQFGPTFICRDGPVLRYDRVKYFLGKREV